MIDAKLHEVCLFYVNPFSPGIVNFKKIIFSGSLFEKDYDFESWYNYPVEMHLAILCN